jgi:hypothetical protein
MEWDGCKAARPDIRRHSHISNFTATLPFSTVPISPIHRATSTIIEKILDGGYEIWKTTSGFWDAVWRWEEGLGALGMPEEVSGFCGWPVSEMK